MARAAGTFTALGILQTARSIRRIVVEDNTYYSSALGRIMMAQDLAYTDDEYAAISEAYEEVVAAETDEAGV